MLMLIMSKTLSKLLGADEPLFSIYLKELENTSGNPGIDIRLLSEISTTVRSRIKALGLDPHDTTSRELYHSLLNLTRLHDEFLVRRIGGTDNGDVEDLLPRIVNLIERVNIPKKSWVLKHSVAKKMLKAMPPKNVMKKLGYRSVDSMLKRESIEELYGAVRYIESKVWQNKFLLQYHKLMPSDFETRPIKLILLDRNKWQTSTNYHVNLHKQNITHLKEMGIIIILPMPKIIIPGITIATLLTIIFYINEIRSYSAYFKLQQVRSDFGNILHTTLTKDPLTHVTLGSINIHWRVVQRYFGLQTSNQNPDVFQPHLQSEDLQWYHPQEVLYRLEPALHFWHKAEFVGMNDTNITVSFNIMDMAINFINKISYEHQVKDYLKSSLLNEIYLRYMNQENHKLNILNQLEHDMAKTNFITTKSI
ncbi:MAG: hypothetical protein NVSMB46_06640 [Candidatus Saccharimonadales bacterium]